MKLSNGKKKIAEYVFAEKQGILILSKQHQFCSVASLSLQLLL